MLVTVTVQAGFNAAAEIASMIKEVPGISTGLPLARAAGNLVGDLCSRQINGTSFELALTFGAAASSSEVPPGPRSELRSVVQERSDSEGVQTYQLSSQLQALILQVGWVLVSSRPELAALVSAKPVRHQVRQGLSRMFRALFTNFRFVLSTGTLQGGLRWAQISLILQSAGFPQAHGSRIRQNLIIRHRTWAAPVNGPGLAAGLAPTQTETAS